MVLYYHVRATCLYDQLMMGAFSLNFYAILPTDDNTSLNQLFCFVLALHDRQHSPYPTQYRA